MAKLAEKRNDVQDRYVRGDLTVQEFIDKILNSKDGDRKRRKLEEKYLSLVNQQKTNWK
jgi:hypothetical protein